MRTANQLTFMTYETDLKLKPNDPTKVIFDHINWSFIHPLVKDNTYLALCAQIIKRIGAAITEGLIIPETLPFPVMT